MKVIRIGDPHAQQSNLTEMSRLIDFVADLAKKENADRIEVMGDLFHNHYVVRLEVMKFWMQAAEKLGKVAPAYLLVGNHDQPGDYGREQLMSALDCLVGIKNVTVVNRPTMPDKETLMLPHTSDQELFAKWILEFADKAPKYLVCHQTFDGSKYDNGMYAPDGFATDLVKGFDLVYSGHIHTSQKFSNVFYTGTPRWDSISDAGQEKGVWVCKGSEHSLVPTKGVVSEIKLFEVKEGGSLPQLNPGDRNYVVLEGSSAWISKKSKELSGLARVTPRPTDTLVSSGSRKASTLEEFAEKFSFVADIKKDAVLRYIGVLGVAQ